jgi:hypothetical protein
MDNSEETLSTSSSYSDERVEIPSKKSKIVVPKKKTKNVDRSNGTGLYIIYSKWSLSRIARELEIYGGIGLLRIVCDGEKETNRTLALLEDDVYDKLSDKGYTNKKSNKGFNIAKFNEKALDLPSKSFTKNLFVPVPEIFRKDDMKTIDIIDDKLKHLVEWDVLPKDSWYVNAILKSREKGAISSGCFIVFDNEMEIGTIAKVKMLITDNFWPSVSEDIEREQFKCLWARKKEHKKDDEKDDEKDEKEDKPKKSRRKIKLEDDEESKPKKSERKIKLEEENTSKLSKRKIKSEEVKVVTIIPTVSQPVEILDDIVTEDKALVALSTISQSVKILDDIIVAEGDIVTEEKDS